jgi:hypothetical protein
MAVVRTTQQYFDPPPPFVEYEFEAGNPPSDMVYLADPWVKQLIQFIQGKGWKITHKFEKQDVEDGIIQIYFRSKDVQDEREMIPIIDSQVQSSGYNGTFSVVENFSD